MSGEGFIPADYAIYERISSMRDPEDRTHGDDSAVDDDEPLPNPVPVHASGAIRDGIKMLVEAQARQWFCSGEDCSEFDHGRDEGLRLALLAIDFIDIDKAISLPPLRKEGKKS